MSHLFCGACGTKFSEGDKFCKKCGSKRKINIPDMQPSSKSNRPLQAPDPVPCNFPSASQIQAPVQLPVQSPVQKSEQVNTNKTPLNSTAQTPAKPASQPSVEVATQEKQSTAAPKKKEIPQSQKSILSDSVIKSTINTGGTFIWAILLLVLGIISFAATQLHVGLAFIGLMLCFSSIMAFIRTAKKIRYRKNYKLVLRKCVKKQIHESDDGDSYYLYFLSFMDTLNYLSAEVSKKEYDATEIGDLFYIAASKKHKNDDYDVAAYFSESKWRLE